MIFTEQSHSHFKSTPLFLAVDLPDSIVLVNEGHTLYSTGEYQILHKCKSEHIGFYFCPASLFAFLPVKEEGACEVALIQHDASESLNLCPYTQLQPKPFYHESFMVIIITFLHQSHDGDSDLPFRKVTWSTDWSLCYS